MGGARAESAGGKLKTIAQSVAISLALLPLWLVFGDWINWVNTITMTVALALTVYTGIEYLVAARRENQHAKPSKNS